MTDGLKDTYREAIIALFAACPRVDRAVLFGSRAMGTFRRTSDVDIALFGDELTMADQAKLKEQIEDLSMPQSIDLLLYRTLENDNLREHIRRHGVEWFRRTAPEDVLSTNEMGRRD